MIDARRLKLIPAWRYTPFRSRARSIEQHRIDSRPCLCHSLHGHCHTVECPGPRHEGETN